MVISNDIVVEWRCRQCLLTSIKDTAESYAFQDAQTSYNLLTFAKYANDWKQNHFHKDPLASCYSILFLKLKQS